jgi:hypothetical protein
VPFGGGHALRAVRWSLLDLDQFQGERRVMVRRLCVWVGLFILAAATARAQAVDARKALEASAKAMGAENLKTIQYSGSGWFSNIGQTYGLRGLAAL